MAQDILETLVRCSSGGKKISPLSDPDPNPDTSFPPESITIPLSDHHLPSALSYDRDDSAKESTNPKSHHPNNNNNPNPNLFRSGSQRYAKTSGPIIGLPNRIKHVTGSARNYRSSTTNSRIFPRKKKPGSVPIDPPSSPKVSCFGKVLSDRERSRNRDCVSTKKRGWFVIFVSLFACGGFEDKKKICGEDSRHDDLIRSNVLEMNIPTEAAAPGIGGMMRFASGRRSASWESDVEVGHVAVDLRRRSVDGSGAV